MLRLGFGVSSYFMLLSKLIFTFILLTLVHIPVIYQYSRYNAISENKQDRGYGAYSLGNLG